MDIWGETWWIIEDEFEKIFDVYFMLHIEMNSHWRCIDVWQKFKVCLSNVCTWIELNLSTFRVRWFSETKGKYFREYSEKRNSLIAQLRHFQLEKVRGCQGSCQQMAFTQSWNLMLFVIKNKQVWIVSE